MFYLLALLSMISSAVQSVLMAGPYRRNPIWGTAYRGLALGILMLPLLIFAKSIPFSALLAHSSRLTVACVGAGAGNILRGRALRHLPIGIATSICNVGLVITLTIFARFFLGDIVSGPQYLWIAVVVASSCALAIIRSRKNRKGAQHSDWSGIAEAFLSGVLLGVGFFKMIAVARSVNPLFVAWAWEFGIGGVCTMYALGMRRRSAGPPPPLKEFRTIFLCASPTVLGTGLFAVASTLGPSQVLTAISVGGIMITTILSKWIHHETLTRSEWLAIGIIAISIMGLKIS